jgi:hypothetical protein
VYVLHVSLQTGTPYDTFLPFKALKRSTSPLQKGHTLVTPATQDVLAPHREELTFDTTFSTWKKLLSTLTIHPDSARRLLKNIAGENG